MHSSSSIALLALLSSCTLASPLQDRAVCASFAPGAISPYALVPISKTQPDKAFGSVSTGIVTRKDKCTIVNLMIPDSINGELTVSKICTLSFALPISDKVSAYGPGHYTFTGYMTGQSANDKTTYNKQPLLGPSPPFPPAVMVPGNTYKIADLPCEIPPGTKEMAVAGALCSSDSEVQWEQTGPNGDGGCPVGFFVEVHDA